MKKLNLFFVLVLFYTNSIAQWKVVSMPTQKGKSDYEEIYDLKINGDLLYAKINESIYVSINNGESWMNASPNDSIRVSSFTCLGSDLYVGTSERGIFLSTNYGSTYEDITNNLPKNVYVSAIIATDNVLAAILNSKVYISVNKNHSWSAPMGLSENVTCLASDGLILYAGTLTGVYKSVDNGKSWNRIGQNMPIMAIAAKNHLIYASEYSPKYGRLFSMTDTGDQWKIVSNLSNYTINNIAITDEYVYVVSRWQGAFRSADNGLSWTWLNKGINDQVIVTVIVPYGNLLFAGCNNGIAVSTNNGSLWNYTINNFNPSIRSIGINVRNLIATTNKGIITSSDEGLNWDQKNIDMNVIETNDSIVYIGGENEFYRSTDFGKSLMGQNIKGLPDHPRITDIVASGSMAFASLYDYGVYFTNDLGWNWSALNIGLTDFELLGLALADSTIFAASLHQGVFRSTDLGKSWRPVNNGLLDTTVNCLSNYKNTIYAGTNRLGIFKSVDKGNTWVHIQNEFSNSKILSLYAYGANIFAGIEGKGLYMSPNNGIDWEAYNTGLYDLNVISIAVNDTNLYIGTKGGAIWKRAIKDFPISLSVKSIDTSDKVVCEGNSTTLTVQPIGGHSPYTYLWNDGSTTSTIHVNPFETTTYGVTVSDAYSMIATDNITIRVNAKPATPVVKIIGDTLISNYISGNIWMVDGEIISNATSNKIHPEKRGSYSVKVSVNGCTSDASNAIIADVKNIINANDLKIYPNPAHGTLIIEMNQVTDHSVFSIINTEGQVIFMQEIVKPITRIDIGNFPRGIYVAKFENNDFVTVKKIGIE